MADSLLEVTNAIRHAERLVNLLCSGFSVSLNPTWSHLANKVIKDVEAWDETKALPKEIQHPPYVVYRPFLIQSGAVLAAEDALPSILFKQFKNKFMTIIHNTLLPAIKEYKKQNPTLDVNIFRPLLEVKLK